VWNAWRAGNPSLLPNLFGLTLSVGERQMGPINGGPINLSFARLRHASLRFATLTGAELEGADLSDGDLREARLNGANLTGADLGGALLDNADFAGARLTGANLCAASLRGARNLTQEQIDDAIGDARTVIPPHLDVPPTWISNQIEPAVNGRNGHQTSSMRLRQPATRMDERVSWLVGGPRSA
jgi:Pentapeptide repeats (8 copies)